MMSKVCDTFFWPTSLKSGLFPSYSPIQFAHSRGLGNSPASTDFTELTLKREMHTFLPKWFQIDSGVSPKLIQCRFLVLNWNELVKSAALEGLRGRVWPETAEANHA